MPGKIHTVSVQWWDARRERAHIRGDSAEFANLATPGALELARLTLLQSPNVLTVQYIYQIPLLLREVSQSVSAKPASLTLTPSRWHLVHAASGWKQLQHYDLRLLLNGLA